jgi:hypothetical protein
MGFANLVMALSISAQTSDEYRRTLQPAESMSPAPVQVQLSVRDKRLFQSDSSALSGMLDSLDTHFALKTVELPVVVQDKLKPFVVQLDVWFFGLMRMQSGSYSARSAIDVRVLDPWSGREVSHGSVNWEAFLGHKDVKNRSSRARIDTDLTTNTAQKLIHLTDSIITTAGVDYRIVTAVGAARVQDSEAETLRSATLDALRTATAKAWGLSVESVDELIDLADVTTSTRSKSTGLVLAYDVDKTLTKRTSDGMLVTVVTALLARPRVAAP